MECVIGVEAMVRAVEECVWGATTATVSVLIVKAAVVMVMMAVLIATVIGIGSTALI